MEAFHTSRLPCTNHPVSPGILKSPSTFLRTYSFSPTPDLEPRWHCYGTAPPPSNVSDIPTISKKYPFPRSFRSHFFFFRPPSPSSRLHPSWTPPFDGTDIGKTPRVGLKLPPTNPHFTPFPHRAFLLDLAPSFHFALLQIPV